MDSDEPQIPQPVEGGLETDAERIDRQLAARLANARPVLVFVYQCTNPKCRAIDKAKFFSEELHPPHCGVMINCWKCRNGLKCGKVEEMIASKQGMVIIRRETLDGQVIVEEGGVH